MTLADLNQNAVNQALAQFRDLGRDRFLERYAFGKARDFFIIADGQSYDSKAIAGAAHGFLPGMEPLRSQDFSGGELTVAKRLRELGFEVINTQAAATAKIDFEIGRFYNRRREIHAVYGGQQQGGICTPQQLPFVFLFTGESGGQFGYRDGPQDDGTFAYTGEGQRGDMEFIRGNRAIRDHIADGKDLLLFEATHQSGMYRFLGCFSCAGWSSVQGPDRDAVQRTAIVFRLVPIATETDDLDLDSHRTEKSIEELRRVAYAAASTPAQAPKDARRSFYERSAAVKLYVLKRANGCCEACGKEAPFLRKNGTPYLEPHHTKRVADGGPDHPAWVGAVCPTCHREIHHGDKGATLNEKLQEYLTGIETGPSNV